MSSYTILRVLIVHGYVQLRDYAHARATFAHVFRQPCQRRKKFRNFCRTFDKARVNSKRYKRPFISNGVTRKFESNGDNCAGTIVFLYSLIDAECI